MSFKDTKLFWYKSKSIHYTCKVDSLQIHITSSHFDTEYYTININDQTNLQRHVYSLEPTQTSVVQIKLIPPRTSTCTQASYAMRTCKRDQVLVKFIYWEQRFI